MRLQMFRSSSRPLLLRCAMRPHCFPNGAVQAAGPLSVDRSGQPHRLSPSKLAVSWKAQHC